MFCLYIEILLNNFSPKEVLVERGSRKRFEEAFGPRFFIFELDDWVFTSEAANDRYFGNNTFQITDLFQLLFQQFFHFGMAEKIFHYVLALMDRFHILQREQYPTAQHTRSHRGNGLVQHIQQARPLLVHRADQLQAAHRKLIEAHIAIFFDTGKRGDMRNMGVLRLIQIIQDGPRSERTAGREAGTDR